MLNTFDICLISDPNRSITNEEIQGSGKWISIDDDRPKDGHRPLWMIVICH